MMAILFSVRLEALQGPFWCGVELSQWEGLLATFNSTSIKTFSLPLPILVFNILFEKKGWRGGFLDAKIKWYLENH